MYHYDFNFEADLLDMLADEYLEQQETIIKEYDYEHFLDEDDDEC